MNTHTLSRPQALQPKTQLAKTQLAKTLLPKTAPRAAFGQIVRNEVRLAWRLPAGLIFGIGLPLLLLIIFGEIPSFHQPQPSLGGLTLLPIYVPILISMAIAIIALISLPGPLVPIATRGSCAGFRPRPCRRPGCWPPSSSSPSASP